MNTVLVTGASDFIGTHLMDYLLENESSDQFRIIALSRKKHVSKQVNLSQPNPQTKNVMWIQDFSELENILSAQNITIDYVVNLAGESIGQGRWTDT